MQCEYKIVRGMTHDDETEQKLGEMAQEGWRLKCVFIDNDVPQYVMELDHGRVTPGNSEREMV